MALEVGPYEMNANHAVSLTFRLILKIKYLSSPFTTAQNMVGRSHVYYVCIKANCSAWRRASGTAIRAAVNLYRRESGLIHLCNYCSDHKTLEEKRMNKIVLSNQLYSHCDRNTFFVCLQ